MFTMELAGHVICVDNQYDHIFKVCKDYLTEKKEEFLVSVSKEEILAESKNGETWPLDYLESLTSPEDLYEYLAEESEGFCLIAKKTP